MKQGCEIKSHSYSQLYLREVGVERNLFLIDDIAATWAKLQLVGILNEDSFTLLLSN